MNELLLELVAQIDRLAQEVDELSTVESGSSDGGSAHVIQDEATPLAARANLNFAGAGVTATDDAGNNATLVTIPGGVSAHTLHSHSDAPTDVAHGFLKRDAANAAWEEAAYGTGANQPAPGNHTHGVVGIGGKIQIGIQGGNRVPQTGLLLDFEVEVDLTITDWTLVADAAGSLIIDLWRDIYANFPPTEADSQTGATPPTLTAQIKNTSNNVSDWTVNWNAGDWVRVNIDSASVLTRATLVLSYTRR